LTLQSELEVVGLGVQSGNIFPSMEHKCSHERY
jgi:hypothetical protein